MSTRESIEGNDACLYTSSKLWTDLWSEWKWKPREPNDNGNQANLTVDPVVAAKVVHEWWVARLRVGASWVGCITAGMTR